jgi:hypothetical protein
MVGHTHESLDRRQTASKVNRLVFGELEGFFGVIVGE